MVIIKYAVVVTPTVDVEVTVVVGVGKFKHEQASEIAVVA